MHTQWGLLPPQPQPQPSPALPPHPTPSPPHIISQSPHPGTITPLTLPAGGTLVTITGRGFPEKGFSPDDSLSVRVGGQPCEVVSSSYASIVCRTSARPSGMGAEVPLAGSYAGMRGVQFDIFPR